VGFKIGALRFAPAGLSHQFAGFPPDSSAWVMFFGPKGGTAKVTVD
jgi:hypothetical protein